MTVLIENAQHPLIIGSGAHFSIVARNDLDDHPPNWEKQLLPTKAKNFKSASGKMTSIGTVIERENSSPQEGFLLGTYHQRMYGSGIYHSKNRHITIGTNKKKKFSFYIYQKSAQDPLEELLHEFGEGQFSTTLTSQIEGHDIEIYLDVERLYPPIIRRPPYPEILETKKEIQKHFNELPGMDFIRNIGTMK
ncbi:hypothetical protein O181_009633 [Austropuccinia psidii MF-1]|uniref:Uncharacterized protein n=1 Tax=Austropuccinia psidii MF-1 TaxID=1389203 RepID=A0A9Q3BRQ4_9BASI|nr:hypothetical protein [Austropuccinia psidii MF-1]